MSSSFRVVYSQAVRAKLEELQALADRQGRGDVFLTAVQFIDQQLRDTPLEFGEALYSLSKARLIIRHGIQGPLAVYWAVHEEASVVFVKDFRLLPAQTIPGS